MKIENIIHLKSLREREFIPEISAGIFSGWNKTLKSEQQLNFQHPIVISKSVTILIYARS